MIIIYLQLAVSHSSKFYARANSLLMVLYLYLCILSRGHAGLPFELLVVVSSIGLPLLVGSDDAHGFAVHSLVHATSR